MTETKTQTPAEQLAALRAARAEREAAAAAARDEAAVLQGIAVEKALAAAEAEHGPRALRDENGKLSDGEIAAFEAPGCVVIVKRPNHLIYRRFSDQSKLSTDACIQLIKPSLVHPDKDAFERLIESYPAVVLPVASLIQELAGARSADTSGK